MDLVKIEVKAGNGGDGNVSFRREKYVPRGGPNGGDGGKGGDVYLVADSNLATLYDFTHQRKFSAQNGGKGKTKNMTGRSGEDLFLRVSIGTVVKIQNDKSKFKIGEGQIEKRATADLTEHEQIVLIAKGGKGGLGNVHFKSSANQTPRQWTPGELGEETVVTLELKLIADVGIIGLPNAGKSTLLNSLTAAQARVGEYPFTTLYPNLGVFKIGRRQIVLADIPGLIEGASQGRGLGDEFLRHIERTRVLVHLIDPLTGSTGKSSAVENLAQQSLQNYQIIRNELREYSEKLLIKPEIVVINKVDVTEIKQALSQIRSLGNLASILAISAATGEGLEELKKEIARRLKTAPVEPSERLTPIIPTLGLRDVRSFYKIKPRGRSSDG